MDVTVVKKLLVSGYLWAFLGRMLTAIFGMAVNAILTRMLPPDEVGVYFLIVSIVTVLSMLAMFGQQRVIVRIIPDALTRGLEGAARQGLVKSYLIVFAATFIVSLLTVLAGGHITQSFFGSDLLSSVIYLVTGLLIVRTASSILAETFRAFHNVRDAVLFNGTLVNFVYAIALLILFVQEEAYSLRHVLLLSIGVYAFNSLVALALTRKHVTNLEHKGNIGLNELTGMGIPLLITGLTLFTLTQADLWIVGYVMDESDVALYGAAVKLVQLIIIPLMIMNAVVPSIISSLYAKNDTGLLEKVLRTAAMVSGVPSLMMLALIIIFSDQILVKLYGEYYGMADKGLIIVSLGQTVNVVSGAGMMVLMMTGRHNLAMIISLFSGLFLVITGLYVAKDFGISGVATVAAMAIALQSITVLLVVRAQVGIWCHMGFDGLPALVNQVKRMNSRGLA